MNKSEQGPSPSACSKSDSTNFWTESEEEKLMELYADNSNQHIAAILKKTKASIDLKASNLGLKKSPSYRKKISLENNKKKRHAWTDDEISFLKSNYNDHSYEKIADQLNRTANAVSQKARQLKLKKYRKTISQIQDENNLKFPFMQD